MGTVKCPIPAVGTALDAFVKPRDEVATIRQDLQASVYSACDTDGPRLSAITVHAQGLSRESSTPSTLSGVRKAYWKAVHAHTAAQSKYDALKADLQQLRSPGSRDSGSSTPSESINDHYLPLLRLRESMRRLQVIDEAFSEIASTGNASSSNSVEGVVRRRNGEPPNAPQSDTAPYRQGPDVEARILQLKKAVLTAKRRLDDYADGPESGSLKRQSGEGGEVAGLQSALNELTSWMETQLSLIGNAEAEALPAAEATLSNGQTSPEATSLEDIADLYDSYLTARETLIYTINSPCSLETQDPSTIFTASSRMSRAKNSDRRKTPLELLLPHIAFLANAKDDEQSMLEQSAYLRRQISAAEGDTDRLVARLADESHLVHPGAACGKDWAKAALSAGTETKTIVRERLEAGEVSVSTAKKALESINAVPIMMDDLVERQ
nr:hypothetical protein CFP56_10190 [Quercus suber]